MDQGGIAAVPDRHGTDVDTVPLGAHLDADEREQLRRRIASARGPARRVLRAQIALLVDDGHSLAEAERLLNAETALLVPTTTERALRRVRDLLTRWSRPFRTLGRRALRSGAVVDGLVLTVLAALTAVPVAMTLNVGRTISGNNDSEFMIQQASSFDLLEPPSPQFLFTLLVRAANLLTFELSLGLAVVIVMVAIRAATALAVYAVFRGAFRDGGPTASRRASLIGGAVVLIMESPRVLLGGRVPTIGNAYVPLNTLWNVTGLTVLPFAIIAAALLVDHVSRAREGPVSALRGGTLASVMVLGCLAKASFAIAFLPAIALWAIWFARGGTEPIRRVLGSVTLYALAPIAIVSSWQLWWSTQPEREFATEGSAGLTWLPLTVARIWGAERPGMWLVLLVPALGVLLGGWMWLRRPKIVLLGVAALAAIGLFLTIGETGVRQENGNMGWGAQLAIYLLAVEGVRAVAAWAPGMWRDHAGRVRVVVAGVVLSTVVASGLVVRIADVWTSSPCLRGEVTVQRPDPDEPGVWIEVVECEGI